MNVLFVHEVDWLGKVVFDIHSLAESLSLLGHRVCAIDYPAGKGGGLKTSVAPAVSRALAGSAVDLIRPGMLRLPLLGRISSAITHYREIDRAMTSRQVDAVVLYSVPTNGWQTLRLARRHGIPVIFRSIDILHQLVPQALLRPPTKLLEKHVYARADMILTLTPKLSDYVEALGADPSRVKLLPMPVDTTIFHPGVDYSEVASRWSLGPEDEVVLFMGTLFDFSGLDILIPRFRRVVGAVPGAKLLVVGDGPQRSRLESIIDQSGMREHVRITGFEPYRAMPQYINLAKVCINTFTTVEATRDIFPGKTVQFLACGKGLLATPLRGMLAVIPGEEQGIVYAENGDGFVDELISLLKSGERRERLGRAGLDHVAKVHGHESIARQLEARLQEAIEEKKNGRLPAGV